MHGSEDAPGAEWSQATASSSTWAPTLPSAGLAQLGGDPPRASTTRKKPALSSFSMQTSA